MPKRRGFYGANDEQSDENDFSIRPQALFIPRSSLQICVLDNPGSLATFFFQLIVLDFREKGLVAHLQNFGGARFVAAGLF